MKLIRENLGPLSTGPARNDEAASADCGKTGDCPKAPADSVDCDRQPA